MKIDHVHMVVSDRPAMLVWLKTVFGIVPAQGFEVWAAYPEGPIFTVTPEGEHAIAVFESREGRNVSQGSDNTIAFSVSAEQFMKVANRVKALGLEPPPGMPGKTVDPVDIELAISVFIQGPEGTRFEITCYDLDALRERLDLT